ncbi:hypothetical protein SAMN04487948_101342 [Halogranum amylolyticum]|uniref:DUF8113 domain-containing protein n=1 Tax=Halogranum amylolyticum TaxID=660520 RepID=A0A1H8N6B6_9EURY|nr:hypothetical protein SAMN04487948_101342 [Halogranum amylolyticum]
MDDTFRTELDAARAMLDDDAVTAFHVGVVRDGEEVDTTFSYRTDGADDEQEGLQALSLLATHLRIVASESGLDYETVAADAVTLASQVEETSQFSAEAGDAARTDAETGAESDGDVGVDTDGPPRDGTDGA